CLFIGRGRKAGLPGGGNREANLGNRPGDAPEKWIECLHAHDCERKFRFHLQRSGRTDPGPSQCPRLRGNLPEHSAGADLSVWRQETDLGCSLLRQPPCLCPERKGNHLRLLERVILVKMLSLTPNSLGGS